MTETSEASVRLDAGLSFTALRDKLQAALDKTYPIPSENGIQSFYRWIKDVYASYFVYEEKGDHWRIDYTLDDQNNPSLGQKSKVEVAYVAAEKRVHTSESHSGELTASQVSDKGWVWNVEILKSGKTVSANASLADYGYPGKYAFKDYSAEAVKGAVEGKLFEGAPLIVRSEEDHLAFQNGNQAKLEVNEEARQIGGTFQQTEVVQVAEGCMAKGKLKLRRNKAGEAVRKFLMDRAAEGFAVPYELSWTGEIETELTDLYAQNPTILVKRIAQVDSIDPVLRGNAGGRILQVAESSIPPKPMKDKNYIKQVARLRAMAAEAEVEGADESKDGGGLKDNLLEYAAEFILKNNPDALVTKEELLAKPEAELVAIFDTVCSKMSSKKEPEPMPEPKPAGESAKVDKASEALQLELEKMKVQNSALYLESRLQQEPFLPDAMKDAIRNQFKGKASETSAIDQAITDQKNVIASLRPNAMDGVNVRQDQQDKWDAGVMNLFMIQATPEMKKLCAEVYGQDFSLPKHQMFTGLKDMYQSIAGATSLLPAGGFGQGAKGVTKTAESLAANQITQLAGDAMHRVMILAYRGGAAEWEGFRKISRFTPVTDFKQYNFENYGMFSSPNSAIASSGDDYGEMNITGNETVGYTLVEQGGMFSINWRDIVNDNVGLITRIPIDYGVKSKIQLARAVFDRLKAMATTAWQSGNNEMHTARNNYATAKAIDGTNVTDAYLQLAQQTELGGEIIGLTGKYLVTPITQLVNAYKVTVPAAEKSNMVATADQSLGLEPIYVPHWTNSTNFWAVLADPAAAQGLEILVLNGNQEPQITQEQANSGANFTAKKMRFRGEHHWKVGVVDFRFAVGRTIS